MANNYREEIARLEQLARDEDNTKRAAQTLAWAAIAADKSNWEWLIIPTEYPDWNNAQTKISGVMVKSRVRPDVLAKWKEGGHATLSNDWMDGKWLGMFYYRTEENILHHMSGGYLILKDVQLCSDEQWESILQGNIPAKFIR